MTRGTLVLERTQRACSALALCPIGFAQSRQQHRDEVARRIRPPAEQTPVWRVITIVLGMVALAPFGAVLYGLLRMAIGGLGEYLCLIDPEDSASARVDLGREG